MRFINQVLKTALFLLCGLTFGGIISAQVTLNTSVLNYFTVWSNDSETLNFTLTNNSAIDFVVTDINLYHGTIYSLSDTAFTIMPGGNRMITVDCHPFQNLNYMDYLLVESSTHPVGLYVQLFASSRYNDSYYNSTQNKSNEELKSALKTLLGTGYTQLTYDAARDQLFMVIDNKAVNGQGAAQNTLECIYTARTALGYTSRQDAQTNDNFDTEHVYPQTFFGAALPMRSDLFHLQPTWSTANNERSSNPFGVVTNPNWTDGGSKSNGNTFEPRDFAKGRIARAMMYFVFRYQDYSGFMAPQEAILRTWHKNFPPDVIDSLRNEDIFALQHNRNPVIDHPELVDRIASITLVDSGQTAPVLQTMTDLYFGSVVAGSFLDGKLCVANQGLKKPLLLTGFSFGNSAFSFVSPPDSVITIDQLKQLQIHFAPTLPAVDYTTTLTFSTNDPAAAIWSTTLHGNTFLTGAIESFERNISVFPNPVSETLFIRQRGPAALLKIQVMDLNGQELLSSEASLPQIALNTSTLSQGIYWVKISSAHGEFFRKITVIRP